MTGEEELAVRQARGAADAAREFVGLYGENYTDPHPRSLNERCAWGDDAWHRAVSRLIRIHRPDYRRLLAEERDKTGGEQP